MSTTDSVPAPAHHRAYHQILTSRLVVRSAVHTDARAIYELFTSLANNPHTEIEKDLSVEVMEARIANWHEAAQKGDSAFMVIILRDPSSPPPLTEDGSPPREIGAYGAQIGFGGFNAFKEGPPCPSDSQRQSLLGDVGGMIDHTYWRQGYALEATSATIEYGATVLGCEYFSMDTAPWNEPWRALMRSMGLGAVESSRWIERTGRNDWNWEFDREVWVRAKEEMKGKGKWLLA
jgi:RimJ/RimL family protein N-acetyltransferase